MKVMLAIKPEFAEKIFKGIKKYEFRKILFKNNSIDTVIVYASSPIKKVIGEFKIEGVISDTPHSIWYKTEKYAGICKEYYDTYFFNRSIAYAIHIGHTKMYNTPKDLSFYGVKFPPQSFIYMQQ